MDRKNIAATKFEIHYKPQFTGMFCILYLTDGETLHYIGENIVIYFFKFIDTYDSLYRYFN